MQLSEFGVFFIDCDKLKYISIWKTFKSVKYYKVRVKIIHEGCTKLAKKQKNHCLHLGLKPSMCSLPLVEFNFFFFFKSKCLQICKTKCANGNISLQESQPQK